MTRCVLHLVPGPVVLGSDQLCCWCHLISRSFNAHRQHRTTVVVCNNNIYTRSDTEPMIRTVKATYFLSFFGGSCTHLQCSRPYKHARVVRQQNMFIRSVFHRLDGAKWPAVNDASSNGAISSFFRGRQNVYRGDNCRRKWCHPLPFR